MGVIFGNWKYIFKNLWSVLPFAALPAVCLAVTLDYDAIHTVTHAFFTGGLHDMEFFYLFRAFSIVRVDHVWSALISVLALLVSSVCFTLMLIFVEKHMRIGKRTLSGLKRQFTWLILPVFCMAIFYLALYEVFAVIVSALLYVVCRLPSTAFLYILFLAVIAMFAFLLLYVVTLLYLFLPCKQVTGFKTYDAFFYSYRLMTGVRGKLLLSFGISITGSFVILSAASLLPLSVFIIIVLILCAFLFMSFGVRMETVYFRTDKLDREDQLKSYREFSL